MALCNTSCVVEVPKFDAVGCEIKTRKAGIPFIGFLSCDYVFTDITDETEWATAVTANDAHILPEGVGAKPETTKVNQKLSSKRAEQLSGETHTITFRTYAVDNATNTDFDVHNAVRNNISAFRLFWIDSNGLFYFHPDYATESAGFEVSLVKWDAIYDEDSKEPMYYDIELAFEFQGIVAGQALPDVFEELN